MWACPLPFACQHVLRSRQNRLLHQCMLKTLQTVPLQLCLTPAEKRRLVSRMPSTASVREEEAHTSLTTIICASANTLCQV